MRIRRRNKAGVLEVSPIIEGDVPGVYIREKVGRGRDRDVQTVWLSKAELERVVDAVNDFTRKVKAQKILDSTAALLVGRMAALDWEKLGGKPPKLCSECRKSRGIPGPGFIHIGLVCSEVRVKFESDSVANFANCAEVNTDGRCVMFEPRPPLANKITVVEWDAKLKELNELGRARKPWWKFW